MPPRFSANRRLAFSLLRAAMPSPPNASQSFSFAPLVCAFPLLCWALRRTALRSLRVSTQCNTLPLLSYAVLFPCHSWQSSTPHLHLHASKYSALPLLCISRPCCSSPFRCRGSQSNAMPQPFVSMPNCSPRRQAVPLLHITVLCNAVASLYRAIPFHVIAMQSLQFLCGSTRSCCLGKPGIRSLCHSLMAFFPA